MVGGEELRLYKANSYVIRKGFDGIPMILHLALVAFCSQWIVAEMGLGGFVLRK